MVTEIFDILTEIFDLFHYCEWPMAINKVQPKTSIQTRKPNPYNSRKPNYIIIGPFKKIIIGNPNCIKTLA